MSKPKVSNKMKFCCTNLEIYLIFCLIIQNAHSNEGTFIETNLALNVPKYIMEYCIFSRLGLFLFTRVLKEGQDRRFDKAKESPMVFFSYWTIQGMEIRVPP